MTEEEKLKRQVALLREGLEWALAEGGWQLWYYGTTPPAVILPGPMGSPARINEALLEGEK